MSSQWILHRFFVPLVAAMCISLWSCNPNGSSTPDAPIEPIEEATCVLTTDTADWYVALFYEGLYYADACTKSLPSPYRLPTKDEAKVLRNLDYPHRERFITSDGYTFGMPSASVSKAGTKTKYSVLGLHIKPTRIVIEF